MSRNFRCLRIYNTEKKDCLPLTDLLESKDLKKGFHAFFCHSSIIIDYHSGRFDPIKETSASTLKEKFKQKSIANLEEEFFLKKNDFKFETNKIYPLIDKPKPPQKFPENILDFGGKLRDTLSSDTPYKTASGYAFYQATIYNLLNQSFEGSPIYDTGGLYREYLLWNDNALWDESAWDENQEKKQFLAWLGSGWLSSRLDALLSQNKNQYEGNPPSFPSEIDGWARAALSSLLEYDAVLLTYFQEKEKTTPPGWKSFYNYINILCDFLPYHKNRDPDQEGTDDNDVSSNSSGDRGGPRLWQGYLGPRMNMHIRHLILDGWITLWPVKDGDKDQLYYQPASLALLYWAAKTGNKPYTNTPEEFIENYRWDTSKLWFGGHWEGK